MSRQLCCTADEGGKRQISVDRQNGKPEQQPMLLLATVVGAKQPAMAVVVVMGVPVVVRMSQAHVSSAWKTTATLSSRRVGTCAHAVIVLSV